MFDSMLQKYTYRYSKKLNGLLEPWAKHLQVKHFCFFKVTNSGHYVSMSSHIPFAEHFFEDKEYVGCPILLNPCNFVGGVSFTNSINDKWFDKHRRINNQKFGMGITLCFVEKSQQGLIGFNFASPSNVPHLDNLHLNELPLFKLFIKRFREDFNSVIRSIDDELVDLAPLVGPDYNSKNYCPMIPKVSDRNAFLKEAGFKFPDLTPRNLDVLEYIAQGYTSKEIGQILNISSRTVEKHIEALRETFFCFTKLDLTRKAQELKTLGFY